MTHAPDFPTSLPSFQRMFPDDAACAAYLEGVRWPEGFSCEHCGWAGEPYRFDARPSVLRCRQCQRDTSLTAGTVMERTHTPLLTWFWGAFLVTVQIPGISALNFQRQLGLKRYETAFQMLHKLRAGMVNPDRTRIGGEYVVEADETYVGGRTRGEGRGVHHSVIVAGAVEVRISEKRRAKWEQAHAAGIPTRGPYYAGRLRLRVIPDRGKRAIEKFVEDNVDPGTEIHTDGWQGYGRLADLGYRHQAVVLGGDPEATDAHLPMIHLVFSNLKAWLIGTHHGVSQQHLQAYLNEYTFRFNRRFWPFVAFNSLLGIAARVESPTYDELYSGKHIHPNPTLTR